MSRDVGTHWNAWAELSSQVVWVGLSCVSWVDWVELCGDMWVVWAFSCIDNILAVGCDYCDKVALSWMKKQKQWWASIVKWQRKVGGERNRKQRIPVNSITSKLVLKSIYASGSTGPFFADHYLNIWIDSTQVSPRKTDFLSRYLVLSEIRYARKRNW